jgi:LysM repeat protein
MSYKVKKGDTLSKIAKAHGMSLGELLKLNNIPTSKADLIYPGQAIKVSADKSADSTSTTQGTSTKPQTAPQQDKSTAKDSNKKPSLVSRIVNTATRTANEVAKTPLGSYAAYSTISQGTPKLETKQTPKPATTSSSIGNTKSSVKNLQEQLIKAGFSVGKWGADGIWGNASKAALAKAEAAGYQLKDGVLVKKPGLVSKAAKTAANTFNEMGSLPLGSYGAYSKLPQAKPKTTPEQKAPATKPNTGSAFYISYPEHRISTQGTGLEKVFGQYIPGLRGHAASIILDANGNATYHTYGRYDSSNGSYRSKQLPARRQGESEEAYLKRIRPHLEYYNNREPVKATYITDVNAQQSREYYRNQPQKGNYGLVIGSTCVGEACAGINAGRSVNTGEIMQKGFVPDTPGSPHLVNFGNYPSYEF